MNTKSIELNNDAFSNALKVMYEQPEIIEARRAVIKAEKVLKAAYRKIALAHWKTHGNDASTGWGYVPEGRYQTALDPRTCARNLADHLWEWFGQNPSDPPGL